HDALPIYIILAWFGSKTGNSQYVEKEKFLQEPQHMGKLHRLGGAGLVWLSQFEATEEHAPPLAWKGEGINPIVILRDAENNYYFGGKGGRATVSHGYMDAGSFVWELDGVRWVDRKSVV